MKIDAKYDNPLDIIHYRISEKISPIFWKLGFTPNMITTLSNISLGVSLYYIYHLKCLPAIIFYILCYFFDCLDGYMARKYNMITALGDYYDHISDTIGFIATIYVLSIKNAQLILKLSPIIIILIILNFTFLHYQEEIYNKNNESKTLKIISNFIPSFMNHRNRDDLLRRISIFKYFGPGTFNIVMSAIIYFVCISC